MKIDSCGTGSSDVHANLVYPGLSGHTAIQGARVGAQTLSVAVKLAPQISILWRIVNAGERLAAAVLLFVLLPFLALSALLVVMLSRRAPWIAHRRVGQHGQSIWVVKLRTMWSSVASQPRKFQ